MEFKAEHWIYTDDLLLLLPTRGQAGPNRKVLSREHWRDLWYVSPVLFQVAERSQIFLVGL